MATDKQIAANRLNAQKCTGPRTEEGKARSSQNALKTGIDAETIVIRTEDPAKYYALVESYDAQFAPANEAERTLVDILITSEWLRRRYLRVETSMWNEQLDGQKRKDDLDGAYTWIDERLARVDRRLNSANRNYTQALKQLRALQAARAADDRPADIATEPLNPESVSFPNDNPTPPPTPIYTPIHTQAIDPETENIPPIAA